MTATRLARLIPSAAGALIAAMGGFVGVGVLSAGLAAAQPAERRVAERPVADRQLAERTVLDIGGRVIAFEARPVAVTTVTVPFEAGNALLLQDAQQRLRQPDLGPFGSSGGAVVHVVSVSGPDRKLAFERARTVRAALVRLGTAEPRGLAAAAFEAEAGAMPQAQGAAGDGRIEMITVRIERLTRASCPACSAATLATAALDSGAVSLVTMAVGAASEPSLVAGAGRSADRREPASNLGFSDRPAIAPVAPEGRVSPADARALGLAAANAAAQPASAQPVTTPAPKAASAAAPKPAAPKPAAPMPAAPTPADAPSAKGRAVAASAPVASAAEGVKPARRSAAMVRVADLRALGHQGGAGCRPRTIVIDDYLPPIRAFACGGR